MVLVTMTTVMIIVTVAEAQALIILVVLAMILDLLVLEMITVVDRVHLVVIGEVLIILIFWQEDSNGNRTEGSYNPSTALV